MWNARDEEDRCHNALFRNCDEVLCQFVDILCDVFVTCDFFAEVAFFRDEVEPGAVLIGH